MLRLVSTVASEVGLAALSAASFRRSSAFLMSEIAPPHSSRAIVFSGVAGALPL